MARKHAVGIVCQNRTTLTLKTLQSLYHTDQPKDSYDLYLIDNGSDKESASELTEWSKSSIIPVKNLIRIAKTNLPSAWNLFLSLTVDYAYRTKLDNDLIFANTPVAAAPFERSKQRHGPVPGDTGTNPGAVPVAGFSMGAGHKIVSHSERRHTNFLQHFEETIAASKLGLCSLAPVKIGQTLPQTIPFLGSQKWRNNPVLYGACMNITKKAFDALGYFQEALPAHIDWEYSQRAMAAGLNIGYVQDYCVIHFGESDPTLSPDEAQKNNLKANEIANGLKFFDGFVHSKWEKAIPKLSEAIKKSTIVNCV